MSKKGYSKEEREQVGWDLLTVGLQMLSQQGRKAPLSRTSSRPWASPSRIHHFLDMVTHSRQYHFFVMTQEEEM